MPIRSPRPVAIPFAPMPIMTYVHEEPASPEWERKRIARAWLRKQAIACRRCSRAECDAQLVHGADGLHSMCVVKAPAGVENSRAASFESPGAGEGWGVSRMADDR